MGGDVLPIFIAPLERIALIFCTSVYRISSYVSECLSLIRVTPRRNLKDRGYKTPSLNGDTFTKKLKLNRVSKSLTLIKSASGIGFVKICTLYGNGSLFLRREFLGDLGSGIELMGNFDVSELLNDAEEFLYLSKTY